MSNGCNLSVCPGCGGEADNGHDRCFPPNPYYCSKCMDVEAKQIRIEELEAENKLYEDALANYEQRVAGLEVESGIYSASLMVAEQKIVKLEAERDRLRMVDTECNYLRNQLDAANAAHEKALAERDRLRDAVRECGKRFAEYGDHAYQALCRDALEGE